MPNKFLVHFFKPSMFIKGEDFKSRAEATIFTSTSIHERGSHSKGTYFGQGSKEDFDKFPR